MPVTLGKNLEIKDNVINAKYTELFNKLNKAYAWKNTEETSAGGTAVVLYRGEIMTTMQAPNSSKCHIGHTQNTNHEPSLRFHTIINGCIYTRYNGSFIQLGTKSDYKEVTPYGYELTTTDKCYAIDTSGKLWYVNGSTETQIGTDTTWESLGDGSYHGYGCCGINNGKIYTFNETTIKGQSYTSLTQCTKLCAYSTNNNSVDGYTLCNGYLYRLINNTSTMIGSSNNWVKLDLRGSRDNCMALNTLGELYYCSNTTVYKQNVENVIDFSFEPAVCITSNNDMYFSSNYTSASNTWTKVFPDVSWTNVVSQSYSPSTSTINIYAIGDGKLYGIKGNSLTTFVATQIGTESGYTKLEGGIGSYSNSNSMALALAWTGVSTKVDHIIYTTKTPQVNDKVYKDENLTIYSTVTSKTNTSVTDEFRTYNRDVANDKSFTGIPGETMHETVSVIDILRAAQGD